MIYTWIGAPGWTPALGSVEPGQRFEIPATAVAGGLADLAQWLKPEEPAVTIAAAAAPTGDTKE